MPDTPTVSTGDAEQAPGASEEKRDVKVTVIIVNWNTGNLLYDCLVSIGESLEMLAPQEVEVIVVDNASTDESKDAAKKPFPFALNLIENDANVGFARANNQGIRTARGKYVLLLNPDTVLRAGALSSLVAFLEAHPSAAGAGPQLVYADGSLQISSYPRPTLTSELFRLFHLDKLVPYGSYHMSKWRLDKPREVDALLGACLMVRRCVLERVGLLDENYFMYSEEIDLCHRIRRAGWGLYWVPQAEVVHYGGQSTRQIAAEMFVHLYRSKVMYFRKHYGERQARVYKLVLFLAALPRILLAPMTWLAPQSRLTRHRAISRQYRRLVLELNQY